MTERVPEQLRMLALRLRRQLPAETLPGLLYLGALPVCRVLPGSEAEAATALAIARDTGVPVMFGRLPRWLREAEAIIAAAAPDGGVPGAAAGSAGAAVSGGRGGVGGARQALAHAIAGLAATGVLLLGNARLGRIGAFDVRRRLVEVQPGVSLAALNRFLRPHGLWLPVQAAAASARDVASLVADDVLLDGGAPPLPPLAAVAGGTRVDPAEGRRAPSWRPQTADGPAGVGLWPGSACMADALLGIDAVLDDGSRQLLGPFGETSAIRLDSGRAGQLVSALFGLAGELRQDIGHHWPWGRRAAGGYLLDCFRPRPARPYTADGTVNLAHLLAGSAGTLAWQGRLHLRPWRRPAVMAGLLLGFASVAAALAGLAAGPGQAPVAALQLLDGRDLAALRASPCPDDRRLWQSMLSAGCGLLAGGGADGVSPGSGSGADGLAEAGWLVLMAGDDAAGVQAALHRLVQAAGARPDGRRPGVVLTREAEGDDAALSSGAAAAMMAASPSGAEGGRGLLMPVWRQLLDAGTAPDAWPLLPVPGVPDADVDPTGLTGMMAALPGAASMAPFMAAGGHAEIPRAPEPGQAGSWAGRRGPGTDAAGGLATMRAGWQAARVLALAGGQALRLPPLAPTQLASRVAMLDETLRRQGVQAAWRGRLDAGELLVRLRPGPVAGEEAARRLLAALAPLQQDYWTPALQAAFAAVRRQFDPAGLLAGPG